MKTEISIDSLKQRLCCFFDDLSLLEIIPLKVDSTNPCFKLDYRGDLFFCKVLVNNMLPNLQRRQMFELQVNLHKQDFAVRPEYFDESAGIWIEQWLIGAPLRQAKTLAADQVRLVAQIQARIHQHAPVSIDVALSDAWQRYINMLGSNEKPKWEKRASELLPLLEADADICFCHNDLNFEHVWIENGKTRVIDWEYAGMGHRTFDLCATIKLNALEKEQIHWFLDEYINQTGLGKAELQHSVQKMYSVIEFTDLLWHNALS